MTRVGGILLIAQDAVGGMDSELIVLRLLDTAYDTSLDAEAL